MTLSALYHPAPPIMLNIHRLVREGAQASYDNQGRFCAPETEVSLMALAENVKLLAAHQQTQWAEEHQIRTSVDEIFAGLERRIEDAMALMHYTIKYYPHVMNEFQAAEKTRPRIGVGDTEQMFDAGGMRVVSLKTP